MVGEAALRQVFSEYFDIPPSTSLRYFSMLIHSPNPTQFAESFNKTLLNIIIWCMREREIE
jgi:hypothetical protein